jgi:DnaD/phage-associated family protein
MRDLALIPDCPLKTMYLDRIHAPYIPHRYQVVKEEEEDKNKEEEETETAAVFRHYSENIGILTPHISDQINSAINSYPAAWIMRAVDLAVEANARRWAYISAILKRWEADGFDDGKKPANKRAYAEEY